jgi:hypothetical protein
VASAPAATCVWYYYAADGPVDTGRRHQRETALWGRLMADGDKRSILQRRQQSVEAHRERAIQVQLGPLPWLTLEPRWNLLSACPR